MNPWKTKSKTTVYENKWIKVCHEDVITPTGTDGIYGTVHFKNLAIGIIPLDENNNTWLVGQFRYALGAYSWEIPEGGGVLADNPLDAAKRELQEEVGLEAEQWDKLTEFNTSNSVTDEKAIIYLARNLKSVQIKWDETELLEIKKIHIDEVMKMIHNGEIRDSLTIIGMYRLNYMLMNKEI